MIIITILFYYGNAIFGGEMCLILKKEKKKVN